MLAYLRGFLEVIPLSKKTLKEFATDQPRMCRDALSFLLKIAFVVIVFPVEAFDFPFLPAKWTQIYKADAIFKGVYAFTTCRLKHVGHRKETKIKEVDK